MLDRWRLDCTEFNFCSHSLHESLGRTLWSPVWKGQNMKQEFVENQYNYTNLKDKFSFAIFLQYILLNKMFLHREDTNTIYLQTVLPLSDLLFLSILPSQRTTSSLFYMNNRYIFHICILVSIHSSEGIMTKGAWICYHCITSWFWLLDVHKWSGEAWVRLPEWSLMWWHCTATSLGGAGRQEILKIESQIFFAMCFVSRPETNGSVGSIRCSSSDTQKGAKFYL